MSEEQPCHVVGLTQNPFLANSPACDVVVYKTRDDTETVLLSVPLKLSSSRHIFLTPGGGPGVDPSAADEVALSIRFRWLSGRWTLGV